MNANKLGITVALAAVAGSGCARQEEALIVTHSPGFASFACFADPGSSTSIQRGTLDLAYGTGYTLPLVLRNNLLSRPGSTSNSGVDDGELQLRDVDVSLTMEQAPEVLREVAAQDGAFVEFSQSLAADSLAAGQDTGVIVDIVTESASAAFRSAIENQLEEGDRPILTAEIVFHATRTGNSVGSVGVLDSRVYTFPVELCINCLPVSCETCPDAQCPPDADFAGPCGNAQDAVLVPSICAEPV